MQNKDDIIQQLTEENRRLKDRLDVSLNTLVLMHETIQQLKDEIAILKGQKPRPKTPPPAHWKVLEAVIREEAKARAISLAEANIHVVKKQINFRSTIKIASNPRISPKRPFSRDVKNTPCKTSFFGSLIQSTNWNGGSCQMALI